MFWVGVVSGLVIWIDGILLLLVCCLWGLVVGLLRFVVLYLVWFVLVGFVGFCLVLYGCVYWYWLCDLFCGCLVVTCC